MDALNDKKDYAEVMRALNSGSNVIQTMSALGQVRAGTRDVNLVNAINDIELFCRNSLESEVQDFAEFARSSEELSRAVIEMIEYCRVAKDSRRSQEEILLELDALRRPLH